jgi:hypothetical protein
VRPERAAPVLCGIPSLGLAQTSNPVPILSARAYGIPLAAETFSLDNSYAYTKLCPRSRAGSEQNSSSFFPLKSITFVEQSFERVEDSLNSHPSRSMEDYGIIYERR